VTPCPEKISSALLKGTDARPQFSLQHSHQLVQGVPGRWRPDGVDYMENRESLRMNGSLHMNESLDMNRRRFLAIGGSAFGAVLLRRFPRPMFAATKNSTAATRGGIGADIPWMTYRAADMKTTGTVLGPKYAPFLVETESSGQKCGTVCPTQKMGRG
jgi:hypothetical protein